MNRFTTYSALLILLLATPLSLAEEIPLQAWIHDPVIASVGVSPDGKQLAALTLSNVNEAAEITIWQTNNLGSAPTRFKPKDIKALAISWLNNNNLFVYGRQKYDYRYGGTTTKWFRDKVYIVDDKGRKFREILGNKDLIGASVSNRMPLDNDKILVSATNREFATDLYEVNLKNFNAKRVYRGSNQSSFFTDFKGNVIGRSKFEAGSKGARLEYSYKHPETGAWEYHHTFTARDREGLGPLALDKDGRTMYMSDNTGRDKNVIRKYDLITKKLSEPIYGDNKFEALGVVQSTNPSTYGDVIGYSGESESRFTEFTHPLWKSIQQKINSALPSDQSHSMTSVSDDMNVIVVSSSGDKEAGAYHLLLNQKELVPLGRAYPQLDPNKLADMKYVEYKARDGLTIPAFLTLPVTGAAPYPVIVLPHGGPWARDYDGWDSWAQFFANRGYGVLQPQYRGSQGFGQKLWRAGDREWGQKMQDDKDDGAAWLVSEGIAAKDRIAIFGYSYGGYAAMAAIVRPNSPYQCAISGAGLAELRSFDKVTFENPIQRDFQNPTIAGLSPLDHVDKANIPIYIFHGDRDQRVEVIQSRKYYKALKRAGKEVEYNEIPDLWHSNPWWPTHRLNMFENMEKYLAERCGPGGL